MAGPTESDTPRTSELTADDRAELQRLRAEVAQLRATGGESPPAVERPSRWNRGGRAALAVVLITLGVLLTPLSVMSVWARGQVTDTDRYVETVAPLASDPAVQQEIADKITATVFQYIDVQSLVDRAFTALGDRDVLPPGLATQVQALSVPISNGVRNFAEDQVLELVQTDIFAQAWEDANRAAHNQLVAALTGEGNGSVQVEGDAVRVNMAAFVNTVKQRLVNRGFQLAERIPAVNAEFVILQSADLPKVQRGFDILDTLGYWLPFACALLIGVGVYVARNHRRALIAAGLGGALAMLATGVALQVGRQAYLNGVPPDVLSPAAAAALYDTMVRFLREAIRAGALLGLVVAAGAFLTGPSVTATTVRRGFVAGFGSVRGLMQDMGAGLDSVTTWVGPRARVLRGSVVVAALAVVLLVRYKTPELIGWLTLGVLLLLAVIQLLATPPRPRSPRAESTPDVGLAPAPTPAAATLSP